MRETSTKRLRQRTAGAGCTPTRVTEGLVASPLSPVVKDITNLGLHGRCNTNVNLRAWIRPRGPCRRMRSASPGPADPALRRRVSGLARANGRELILTLQHRGVVIVPCLEVLGQQSRCLRNPSSRLHLRSCFLASAVPLRTRLSRLLQRKLGPCEVSARSGARRAACWHSRALQASSQPSQSCRPIGGLATAQQRPRAPLTRAICTRRLALCTSARSTLAARARVVRARSNKMQPRRSRARRRLRHACAALQRAARARRLSRGRSAPRCRESGATARACRVMCGVSQAGVAISTATGVAGRAGAGLPGPLESTRKLRAREASHVPARRVLHRQVVRKRSLADAARDELVPVRARSAGVCST